jgi:hypothetical protein
VSSLTTSSAPATYTFSDARPALVSPDGRYEVRWDAFFRSLSFKDLVNRQVSWSTTTKVAPVLPVRLSLTPSGELLLTDSQSQVLWSSGTKGIGRPPHVLQILDGALVVADGFGATTWLAPATCPAGIKLSPWQQCGGSGNCTQPQFPCKDAQYPSTCCPAGWYCYRQTAAAWRCMPTAALDRCSGSQVIAAGQACGGTASCRLDASCSSSRCCAQGSVCQRLSAERWECVALPKQPVQQTQQLSKPPPAAAAGGRR